jgi:hypothetical protein
MRPEVAPEVGVAAPPTAADERAGAAPQPASLLQPGGQPSDRSRRMLRRMTHSPQIQVNP